jgi:hypothetical protein
MALTSPDGSSYRVSIGYGLDMFDTATTRLFRSSPNSGLAPRTLRNWWIWVEDQVNPGGWSVNKNEAQQSDYLQKTWASRWLYYMQELNKTIREVRPNVKNRFLCS